MCTHLHENTPTYTHNTQGNRNVVAVQDLLFAAHAMVFSCITVAQIFFCGYDRGTQRLSWWCIAFIAVAVLLAIVYMFCCVALDAKVGTHARTYARTHARPPARPPARSPAHVADCQTGLF